jgi:hypothetical protein
VRGLLGVVLATLSAAWASGADPGGPPGGNPALEKWYESVGGEPALESVRAIESKESVEQGPAGKMSESRTLVLGSARIRVDIEVSAGRTLTMAYDGKVGWREVADLGFGLLGPADTFWVFLAHHPMQLSVIRSRFVSSTPMPSEMRDGSPREVFLVTDTDGQHSVWFFEPASGVLTSIEGATPNGMVMRFGDYRKVGPLRIPFEFQMYVGHQRVYAVHRQTVTLNLPLTGEFFSPLSWDLDEAAKAQAILDRYLKTCADAAVLGKVRSRIVHSTVDVPSSGVTSTRTVTIVYPNKILIDTETKGIGQKLAGYDGMTGWAYSELQGYHLLKAAQIPELFSSLSSLGDPAIETEAPLRRIVGSRYVAGRKTTALALSSLRDGLGTFYFDDENGRILRIASQKRSAAGNKPIATIDLSDFRKVDGQDIPFEVTETRATAQIVSKILSLENNPSVDATVFKPRPEE